jgi:stalled ribosome rescue protein Dom34
MFDREHTEAQRIKSRSHHKHQGKAEDLGLFFTDIAQALSNTREVLLAGPGLVRNQFRDWCAKHHAAVASVVVDSVAADHPTDAQLVAMARQYFKKFDNMAAEPSMA